MIAELTSHLWQSTLFAAAAGLLALAFRKNRAQVRYWLWFSASLKFVLPFSLLMSPGGNIHWTRELPSPTVRLAMDQVTQPFSDSVPFVPSRPRLDWTPVARSAVWLCGFAAIVLIRIRSWRHW
jgi:bla regulator protein BlaR1